MSRPGPRVGWDLLEIGVTEVVLGPIPNLTFGISSDNLLFMFTNISSRNPSIILLDNYVYLLKIPLTHNLCFASLVVLMCY